MQVDGGGIEVGWRKRRTMNNATVLCSIPTIHQRENKIYDNTFSAEEFSTPTSTTTRRRPLLPGWLWIGSGCCCLSRSFTHPDLLVIYFAAELVVVLELPKYY